MGEFCISLLGLGLPVWVSLLLVGCQATPPHSQPPSIQLCCGAERDQGESLPVPGFASARLGDLPEGPPAVHVFAVHNDGESEIEFQAEPVCNYPGRVQAKLAPRVLKPGQKATLQVSFTTRGQTGPFDVFVRVTPTRGVLKIENYHLAGYVMPKTARRFSK